MVRFQGKISNWNDAKGFGFVRPNGGGDKSFVHIKDFVRRGIRPMNGDIITYQQVKDNTGRFKAKKIEFPRHARRVNKTKSKTRLLGSTITCLFCLSLVLMMVTGKLPLIIFGVYIVASLITVLAYAIDKSAAKKGRWRTQESTLHLFSLLGGWPGAFYAQNRLRHKSSKTSFKTVFWITAVINSMILGYLLTDSGAHILRSISAFTY